uniref:CTP synthase n=1 Tax=Haptolina brevifila TaxID=156173 RepID=A0A7S2H0U2_9EUKA|mmetsp:Transcript_49930/g.99398  ORF Transcript_49930/g.99398 Transcript_49930/m.99398 type:complete len:678 (+) Transcript_49930:49-2082(+)
MATAVVEGEVVAVRDGESIELTVECEGILKDPIVYAYEAGSMIGDFLKQLAKDLEKPESSVRIATASGAMLSSTMTHSLAWKPGRILLADGVKCEVACMTVDNEVDTFAPSSRARRGSVKSSSVAPMKYIVVTGGVVSGLGKGVTASSIGVLMRSAGYRVTSIKIDPYLNVDAGTMSPFEHGEVFTLDDGGEVDLDLGNYERFNELTLTRDHNITTGKVYQQCLEKERRGDYLGKTVQVIPHVTDAIMEWIERVAKMPTDGLPGQPNVCIIELGGTVGDIESMPFVEALRQFQFRIGRDNILFFHVSLVPVLGAVGEEKTKPTQHSVQNLRAAGLSPDFLVCRSSKPLSKSTKQKLANFCHVPAEHCLGVHDLSNIYRVPMLLHSQDVTDNMLAGLKLLTRPRSNLWNEWRALAELVDSLDVPVRIAVVGKYTDLSDAYLSISKALYHAANKCERKLVIDWIESETLAADNETSESFTESWAKLKGCDGVLVPGGFGNRGVEGKIAAAKYARENGKPYLGVCLGFQIAVIEFARNMCGKEKANSTELDESTPHPVVLFMPEGSKTHMGGTMRLGARRTELTRADCQACRLYGGQLAFDERHRHRYEVNIDYVSELEAKGLEFVGRDTKGERMEIFELKGHPFFIGAQYHPEFKSRPLKPSPLFYGLLCASSGVKPDV